MQDFHYVVKDRVLHGAAAGMFVAHDRVNYLLRNEKLAEVIEGIGMITLRKSQGEKDLYGEEIQRTKRALEKLEEEYNAGEAFERE